MLLICKCWTKSCKELGIKSTSEAHVTSTQCEGIAVNGCCRAHQSDLPQHKSRKELGHVLSSNLNLALCMNQSKLTLLIITTRTTTFNEYLLYARLCAMHLTFTDQLILLIITQSGFYYLFYFIVANTSKTEKLSFRNMHQLKIK